MNFQSHRDPGDENDRKFAPPAVHPGLSQKINDNILSSVIAGGADITKRVGQGYKVTTKYTIYTLVHVGPQAWDYQLTASERTPGSWKGRTVTYLDDPTGVKVNIHGSTWGGSMLKIHFIGRGMYLEFGATDTNYNPPCPKVVLTSTIEDIEEIS